jgi:hypothetical protein
VKNQSPPGSQKDVIAQMNAAIQRGVDSGTRLKIHDIEAESDAQAMPKQGILSLPNRAILNTPSMLGAYRREKIARFGRLRIPCLGIA